MCLICESLSGQLLVTSKTWFQISWTGSTVKVGLPLLHTTKMSSRKKRRHHKYPFYYLDNFKSFRAEIGKTFKNKYKTLISKHEKISPGHVHFHAYIYLQKLEYNTYRALSKTHLCII